MSVLAPLPEALRGERCFACKSMQDHQVSAVMILLEDPLMKGEAGFSLAPLCGHHAEIVEVDGLLPSDLSDEWKAYVLKHMSNR